MPIDLSKPNLNTGKAWSQMDVDDLTNANRYGSDVTAIADFLCRNQTEVYVKAKELGRRWSAAQPRSNQAKTRATSKAESDRDWRPNEKEPLVGQ
jgi:hypothetical protein